MRKLQLITISVLLFLGCGRDKNGSFEPVQQEVLYEYGKMPKKQAVNQEVATILNEWEAFSEFSSSIDILYQATSSEDLALAIEDLMAKEKLLQESNYPEEFDVPQIKSRQQVLLTFMLKAKGDLNGRRNPTASMVQFFDAYNALRNQFNVISNNKLELNLFLNEE